MPFQPNNLSDALQNQLIDFFKENDFATLYKSYAWRRDTYPNGFPDILKLARARNFAGYSRFALSAFSLKV